MFEDMYERNFVSLSEIILKGWNWRLKIWLLIEFILYMTRLSQLDSTLLDQWSTGKVSTELFITIKINVTIFVSLCILLGEERKSLTRTVCRKYTDCVARGLCIKFFIIYLKFYLYKIKISREGKELSISSFISFFYLSKQLMNRLPVR